MLLPEAAEQPDVFSISGRGIGVTQRTRGKLDPIAHGNDVVGVEVADHEPLRMQIANRIERGIEDFARFPGIEGRTAESRRESFVRSLEDGVEDDLPFVICAAVIKEFDQIRVTKLANAMPEIERRRTGDYSFGHELYDGAMSVEIGRSLKERGVVIASQALFERVISGKGDTFPTLPQMSHKNPNRADLALLWHVVLSMEEPRAKKIVRKSYANYGYEPVNIRYIATGPPGAAVVDPDSA